MASQRPEAESPLSGPIPLFPLHAVLFPGAVLSLHVFEPRYRRLVEEGRDFGIVLIREGREVGDVPEVHEVGTLATLHQVEALADGRYNVIARGLHRFRIRRLLAPDPYLRAEVEALDDELPRARPRLMALLQEYLGLHGLEVTPELSMQLGQRAVWLTGAVLQAEAPKRQLLLESGDAAVAERLVEAEITKLREIGRLAPVRPPGFSPN